MTQDSRPASPLEISYTLRSLFFYRKLQEGKFAELYSAVTRLDCSRYDFTDLAWLGIAEEAARLLVQRQIPVCHVFCHPHVIEDDPKLLAYYRGAAAISQKGVHQLSKVDVRAYELGTQRRPLSFERASQVAATLNRLISATVLAVLEFNLQTVQAQVLMTAGVQADGSWRQQIGVEAANLVKQMIVNDLQTHGCLVGITEEHLTAAGISQRHMFQAQNGYTIVFGSEPDVSIRSPDGKESAVIEIKGGRDPAGALERYGAAKKSFDDALARNPSVITVYLANVITATVADRISADRSVRETFDLSRILVEPSERERFLNQLYWWLHLQRPTH